MSDAPGPPRAVCATDTTRSPRARLKPVALTAVKLMDSFWAPRIRINREVTLPSQYRQCEDTGRIDNFRIASGRKPGEFQGIFFNDSDVYKWAEAASWTVADGSAPRLATILAMVASEIAAAQQPDGYLNTYFMGDRAKDRWVNLKEMHELYCAGHFFQAAVAHWRATGREDLLAVARRLGDHLDRTFGPAERGKREGACGHPEVEMALVELYRATGERRYLSLAEYFIDARGRGVIRRAPGEPTDPAFRVYCQDHLPLRDQGDAVGHAVRALYLYAGAADLLAEMDDPALRAALDRLWDSATGKRCYVTGGLGSRHEGEAFGVDYELPNARAYAETCAAIALTMWAWRMLQLGGEAKYADQLEWTLYNGVLAGLALDGESYFYVNPLEDDGHHRRAPWFGCACCPPNLARTLAALPGWFYGRSAEGIWVHLYAMGSAEILTPGGRAMIVNQYTNYPWDGRVRIVLEGELDGTEAFDLFVRVPGWARGATLSLNGAGADPAPVPGTYATVHAPWRAGDELVLELPMPVRRLAAHPHVEENAGRVALARGPLVYCLESVDHPGTDLRDLAVPAAAELQAVFRPDLLGGTVVLAGTANRRLPDRAWTGHLYAETGVRRDAGTTIELLAVPYALWANRSPGRLAVWLDTD